MSEREPSNAAYAAAYVAFCEATGEHDQDEGILAALRAAYAVDFPPPPSSRTGTDPETR